jgi:hypothetical protein
MTSKPSRLPSAVSLSIPADDAPMSWLVPPLLVPALIIAATVAYGCYRYIELGAGAFR